MIIFTKQFYFGVLLNAFNYFIIALPFGQSFCDKGLHNSWDSNSILLEREKILVESFRILSGELLDTYRIEYRYLQDS